MGIAIALEPEPRPAAVRPVPKRPRSLGLAPLTARELAERQRLDSDPGYAALVATRPRTRGQCMIGPRPCRWISCAHHLGVGITPSGAPYIAFPDAEGGVDLQAMPDTCDLDVADRGGVSLAAVAALIRVTRERVRQLQVGLVRKVGPVLGPLLQGDEPARRPRLVSALKGRSKPAGRPAVAALATATRDRETAQR